MPERPLANLVMDRGPGLPDDAECYRTIGPFSRDTIPAGLLRRHDLKQGTWGVVTILSGEVDFAWDDGAGGAGGTTQLVAGQAMLVPPTVPHHLAPTGEVMLEIGFWSARA